MLLLSWASEPTDNRHNRVSGMVKWGWGSVRRTISNNTGGWDWWPFILHMMIPWHSMICYYEIFSYLYWNFAVRGDTPSWEVFMLAGS